MTILFHNLLISAPNHGGLFYIFKNNLIEVDSLNTTGIQIANNVFYRGVQPSELHILNKNLLILRDINFGDVHDLLLVDESIYLVATEANEILKLDLDGKIIKRWKFSNARDSWHINCIAKWNGRIVFSAFGEFSHFRGYKDNSKESGFVQDLHSGERIITGLTEPHSLKTLGEDLFLVNSKESKLCRFSVTGEKSQEIALDGYLRGVTIVGDIIYVGVSASRNSSDVAGNTNKSAKILALSLNTFQKLGEYELQVPEIYDIMHISSDEEAFKLISSIGSSWRLSLSSQIDGIKVSLVDVQKNLQDVEKKNQWLNATLDEILNSKSWLITRPLRITRHLLQISFPREIKKSFKEFILFVKRNHHYLPVSNKFKMSVYRRFYIEMPWLLGASTFDRLTISAELPEPTVNPEISEYDDVILNELSEFFLNATRIESTTTPLVSVIIPVYGKINYTLTCLKSIMRHPPSVTFEIIVVDDCSTDNSFEILKSIKGIQLLRNKKNEGFIRTCNFGASVANGTYLYFLNNDTMVTLGWLDQLVETFNNFSSVGLVGSKLIYADGRLQEAGGVVWRNGSAWNYGRLSDPNHPNYNYAREVSYCSGASLLVQKALFEEIGGFDELYLPAYYEDVDLAFSVRSKGYKVIYQPLSVIIHFEGITSGTNLQEGIKKYQTINQKLFTNKWQKELSAYEINGRNIERAINRDKKFNVLVIDSITPAPKNDAGSLLAVNLMLILRALKFKVTFLADSNYANVGGDTEQLNKNGIRVLHYPYCKNIVEACELGGNYDLVLFIRPKVLEHNYKVVKKYFNKAKTIYHTIDLHYARLKKEAELKKSNVLKKRSLEIKKIELDSILKADASIVVSDSELSLLKKEINTEKVRVIPLILKEDSGKGRDFNSRADLVFVGSFQHAPNEDAILYFVSKIYPLVQDKLPDIKFHIVGANPPRNILDLQSDSIFIHGFIHDLEEFMGHIKVSVAPLRFGAGIKGKVASAMMAGLPVVASTMAVDGMGLTHQENVLVADDPKDFAEAIIALYEDEKMWSQISLRSREYAISAWGKNAITEMVVELLSDLEFDVSAPIDEIILQ